MESRPYDPRKDESALWDLKQAFETELATGTGGEEKRAAYDAKLTQEYRKQYLDRKSVV